MSLSIREFWTVAHGMLFGAVFLLAFAGGLAGLYSLRPEWVTVEGARERIARLSWGTWLMAGVAWLVSWAVLHRLWKDEDVPVARVIRWTLILVAVGLLGTFPPVFEALE